jgi:hypothetical protein
MAKDLRDPRQNEFEHVPGERQMLEAWPESHRTTLLPSSVIVDASVGW